MVGLRGVRLGGDIARPVVGVFIIVCGRQNEQLGVVVDYIPLPKLIDDSAEAVEARQRIVARRIVIKLDARLPVARRQSSTTIVPRPRYVKTASVAPLPLSPMEPSRDMIWFTAA